jgi:uncharacterized protein YoxC
MKTLDTIEKYQSGIKIETLNGKTKITVDGKSVSPTSKKGKRILADMQEKVSKLDKVIDSVMLSAEKVIKSIGNIF